MGMGKPTATGSGAFPKCQSSSSPANMLQKILGHFFTYCFVSNIQIVGVNDVLPTMQPRAHVALKTNGVESAGLQKVHRTSMCGSSISSIHD